MQKNEIEYISDPNITYVNEDLKKKNYKNKKIINRLSL